MIAPSGGVGLTHHKDVLQHLVNRGFRAGPDGVEECECGNVNFAFSWKLTKQEVECWSWRCAAQFEKTSEGFVLEDFNCLHVWRTERKSLQTRQEYREIVGSPKMDLYYRRQQAFVGVGWAKQTKQRVPALLDVGVNILLLLI